jgi:6-phosphogluconolactonase (cycloisomerase 2 family)
LSEEHSTLFAVNAGSGNVSVFSVHGPNLRLEQVVHSGGSAPVAIAQHDNLVYVLNFAGNSNVVGFSFDDGRLTPIKKSIRYLTAANSGASSVVFSPDGKFLVATEKLTNNIDVFPVMGDGTLGPVVTTKDALAGLFDAAFAPNGALLTLEAAAQTISSYMIEPSGALTGLSLGVPTTAAATCWHVVTPDGRFVYTANTVPSNISGYSITGAGILTALPGTVVGSNPPGSTNLDLAITGDGKFLYSVNSGTGTIGMFSIGKDGKLTLLGDLPAFAAASGFNGIAAL